MTSIRTQIRFANLTVGIVCVARYTVGAQTSSASPSDTAGTVPIAFSHALPHLNGDHLKATVVEVTLGPGESAPPHSHPCAVIGYVIQGALRTQVKGQAEAVYKAGQSFYEAPNGIHMLSASARSTAPVKFLAYFVCGHDVPLTVAPLETPTSGGKP